VSIKAVDGAVQLGWSRSSRSLPVNQIEPPFSGRSMRMLIVMIGAWLMLSAFLVVAVINEKLQSWVSYLLGASVVIGLAISGTILTLP
jgi:hypothetical protein